MIKSIVIASLVCGYSHVAHSSDSQRVALLAASRAAAQINVRSTMAHNKILATDRHTNQSQIQSNNMFGLLALLEHLMLNSALQAKKATGTSQQSTATTKES